MGMDFEGDDRSPVKNINNFILIYTLIVTWFVTDLPRFRRKNSFRNNLNYFPFTQTLHKVWRKDFPHSYH
jgi:hypothetical protein